MNLLKIVLLSAMAASCAHCGMEDATELGEKIEINEELRGHLKQFHKDRRYYGAPWIQSKVWKLKYVAPKDPMLDGSTSSERNSLGTCFMVNKKLAYIYIVDWVDRLAPATKRLILYHEFGHCILGLGHHDVNSELDIMNAMVSGLPSGVIEIFWDDLLQEMFSRADGKVRMDKGKDTHVH